MLHIGHWFDGIVDPAIDSQQVPPCSLRQHDIAWLCRVAAAFAGLLSGRYRPLAGERVAVLVCGGNTTAVRFDE